MLAVILLLAFFIIRSRKRAKEEEELSILEEQEELMVDDINEEIETEATMRRKQLEKWPKKSQTILQSYCVVGLLKTN